MNICHLSVPLLYDMMLMKVGSEEKVAMKRTEMDISDYFHNLMTPLCIQKRTGGSYKEGLRFQSSDMDAFYFFTDYHVIGDLTDAQRYYQAAGSVILMEYQEHIPPGTVYLRLLYMHPKNKIMDVTSCIQKNFHTYFSSKLFLENTKIIYHGHNVTIHGPSHTNKAFDHKFDNTYGFTCRKWPPQASNWVTRCLKYGWPKKQIIEGITSSGCDFVPIGSRESRQKDDPDLDLEWRLSFVQAEQALVRAMNHFQFLCYALLKIFLKEVLNKDVEEDKELLCSYYLKTVMFWCIQTDADYKWSRENFFESFWKCFKLLLHWVYTGYCPNFFIPQNNLFACRIVGADQQRLFTQMYDLYCTRERCLLAMCSTLQEFKKIYFGHPWDCISHSKYEKDLAVYHTMIGINGLLNLEIIYDWKSLYKVCRMNVSKMTNIEQILITRHVINLYHQIAFSEQSKTKCKRNKQSYVKHKKVGVRLLKLTSEFGCASDPLYLALFHYIDGKFRHSLNILEETKPKLYRDYYFYWQELFGNAKAYAKEMLGKPMSVKMKTAMVFDISILLCAEFSELDIEIDLNKKSKLRRSLMISPFVFLRFLTFLCHHHLASPLATQSLWDLHVLVHANHSCYIVRYTRDIAWDILGICHHLSGNLDMAMHAYYTSLQQPSFHFITDAVKKRILLLQIAFLCKHLL